MQVVEKLKSIAEESVRDKSMEVTSLYYLMNEKHLLHLVSECLAEEPCEGKPHAGFCEGSSIIPSGYYGCSTRFLNTMLRKSFLSSNLAVRQSVIRQTVSVISNPKFLHLVYFP